MPVYTVTKVERNSWHMDGSPVLVKDYIKATRWSDIVRWYKRNCNTTAMLDATLYIDDIMQGDKYSFASDMSSALYWGKGRLSCYKALTNKQE